MQIFEGFAVKEILEPDGGTQPKTQFDPTLNASDVVPAHVYVVMGVIDATVEYSALQAPLFIKTR